MAAYMPRIFPTVAGNALNFTHFAYYWLGNILRVNEVGKRGEYRYKDPPKEIPGEEPLVDALWWETLLEPLPLLVIALLSLLCIILAFLYCRGLAEDPLRGFKNSLIHFLNWCCLFDIPLSEDKNRAAQAKWLSSGGMNAPYPGEVSFTVEPAYENSLSQTSWQDAQASASDVGTQRKKGKKKSRKRSAAHMLESTDSAGEVPKKRSKKRRHS